MATYDELLEQLYDLAPDELRQLAHEAVLIADDLERAAAEQRDADRCGATALFGPRHDRTEVSCELDAHGPEVRHRSSDPFGPGSGAVLWRGGGSCAGDPLPVRDLEFTS